MFYGQAKYLSNKNNHIMNSLLYIIAVILILGWAIGVFIYRVA